MGSTRCQLSVSLDGFVAGPNQSVKDPIGEGGMRLHQWHAPEDLDRGVHDVDAEIIDEVSNGIGAHIMGRKMFRRSGCR